MVAPNFIKEIQETVLRIGQNINRDQYTKRLGASSIIDSQANPETSEKSASPNAVITQKTKQLKTEELIEALHTPERSFVDYVQTTALQASTQIRAKKDWDPKEFKEIAEIVSKLDEALKKDEVPSGVDFTSSTGGQRLDYKFSIDRLNHLIKLGLVGPDAISPDQAYAGFIKDRKFDFQNFDSYKATMRDFERILIEKKDATAWRNFAESAAQVIKDGNYDQAVGLDLAVKLDFALEQEAGLLGNNSTPTPLFSFQDPRFGQSIKKMLQLDYADFPNKNPTSDEVVATQKRNGEIDSMRGQVSRFSFAFIPIAKNLPEPLSTDILLELKKIMPELILGILVKKNHPGSAKEYLDSFKEDTKEKPWGLGNFISEHFKSVFESIRLSENPMNEQQALIVAETLMTNPEKFLKLKNEFVSYELARFDKRAAEARQAVYLHLKRHPESCEKIIQAVQNLGLQQKDPGEAKRYFDYSRNLLSAKGAGISNPFLFQADTLAHLIKNNLANPKDIKEPRSLVATSTNDPFGVTAFSGSYVDALIRVGNNVNFSEFGDQTALIKKLNLQGNNGNSAFLNIIGVAHGNETDMFLGDQKTSPTLDPEKLLLNKGDQSELTTSGANRALVKGGTLALISCNTGAKETSTSNVADVLAVPFAHAEHLLAPQGVIHPNVGFIFDKNGQITNLEFVEGEILVPPANAEEAFNQARNLTRDLIAGKLSPDPVRTYDAIKK